MPSFVRPLVIFGTWLLWILPFFLFRPRSAEKAVQVRPAARWGILLQMAGYCLVYAHRPAAWAGPLELWRFLLGAVFAAPSIVLGWQAIRTLGRQWRIDAGLNSDHELVRGGPYKIVRHPIYASMLGMLLSGIAWAGTLPGWPIGLVLAIAGLEIRIRVEDGLLRERFGAEFNSWTRSVPALLPFIR
jgi:protein-S-isoprenylcysteine O-methyltransferase Ste14